MPPFLLYNGGVSVYLERLETICTSTMLGTYGHLGNGASRDVGGGKLLQEEGTPAGTTAGRLRTAWRAQMCLSMGRGMAGRKKRDVEKSRSWRILFARRGA